MKENLKPCVYKLWNIYLNEDEPRTFCRTVRRVTFTGEVNDLRSGAEGIPSLNRANKSVIVDPKPGDTHVQDEGAVKGTGGPNAHPLKRVAMRCG